MKQARISIDVVVPIADEVRNPDGSITMTPKVYTNFKNTLRDVFREKVKDMTFEDLDTLLESYVGLSTLERAGVPFQPLTTEEALKLKDCVIEEVDEPVAPKC